MMNRFGIFCPETTEIAGLYLDRVIIRSREDKAEASQRLYNWKRACVTIDRWIDCHQAGFTFVPGDMRYYWDDTRRRKSFSHAEALWYGTRWIVLDLDRDVGITRVRAATELTVAEPEAENLLYAACESVSSGVGERGARWHGFGLLESPITTRQRFDALMHGLQSRLRYMTGAGRQPAQPVHGNAKEGAYAAYFEAVLTDDIVEELCEIGYEKVPSLRVERSQARVSDYKPSRGRRTERVMATYESVKDPRLRSFLSEWAVPIYEGAKLEVGGCKEIYYTPCPFRSDHSTRDGATDAFVVVRRDEDSSELKWGFSCFHASCIENQRDWKDFKQAITCPIRAVLRQLEVSASAVEYAPETRVYRGVTCLTCGKTGDFLFDSGRCVYLCSDCRPIDLESFRQSYKGSGA